MARALGAASVSKSPPGQDVAELRAENQQLKKELERVEKERELLPGGFSHFPPRPKYLTKKLETAAELLLDEKKSDVKKILSAFKEKVTEPESSVTPTHQIASAIA